MSKTSNQEEIIRSEFGKHGLEDIDIDVKKFPGETIFVVYVDRLVRDDAIRVSGEISNLLEENSFLVVKVREFAKENKVALASIRASGVSSSAVIPLIQMLSERSRTSKEQPSLSYIPDSTQQVAVVEGRRHHLVFGRRGVGKTALLLETKRKLELRGGKAIWLNIQPLRNLNAQQAFIRVCSEILDLIIDTFKSRSKKPDLLSKVSTLSKRVRDLSGKKLADRSSVTDIILSMRDVNEKFCRIIQNDVFLYLDDIHYMGRIELPFLLDHVHGITRDTSAWIKASGIKHECRVFIDNPPTGLQIGHDATDVNLDITLENPEKARAFLSSVLQTYMDAAGVPSIGLLFSSGAVDRLVLASGGVPRDFMEMSGKSLQIAKQRPNARTVGVQDVNEAAGQTAKQKVGELEDDAASESGSAKSRLDSLNTIRDYLLDQQHCTFFKVAFRDKENRPNQYRMLQSLMDLRMVHLLRSSLSEAHSAGQRSEVYMLDLSQYSGQRLKKKIRVLDLNGKYLSVRLTGTTEKALVGRTPKQLMQLLRSGPYLELSSLEVGS